MTLTSHIAWPTQPLASTHLNSGKRSRGWVWNLGSTARSLLSRMPKGPMCRVCACGPILGVTTYCHAHTCRGWAQQSAHFSWPAAGGGCGWQPKATATGSKGGGWPQHGLRAAAVKRRRPGSRWPHPRARTISMYGSSLIINSLAARACSTECNSGSHANLQRRGPSRHPAFL